MHTRGYQIYSVLFARFHLNQFIVWNWNESTSRCFSQSDWLFFCQSIVLIQHFCSGTTTDQSVWFSLDFCFCLFLSIIFSLFLIWTMKCWKETNKTWNYLKWTHYVFSWILSYTYRHSTSQRFGHEWVQTFDWYFTMMDAHKQVYVVSHWSTHSCF